MIRIGHGYDVHRFDPDSENIVLGGVTIPFEQGLLAHSDGDVAIHALIDAILGALALGDIGQHFPDNDATYKNVDSTLLLASTIDMMQEKGYALSNCDITIIAEKPKLTQYIPQMKDALAYECKCHQTQISVKATPEEGLGIAGKGIAAHAVVLLEKRT